MIEIDLSKYDMVIFSGHNSNENKDQQTQNIDLYSLGTNNSFYMNWNEAEGEHAVSYYCDWSK